MKDFLLIISGLAVIAAGALWLVFWREAPPRSGGVACTTEAKLCPDGSAVGRTGPNCEFAACPAPIATTTSPTATSTTATTTGGSGAGGSILPYDSGVRGAVSLGPTCPVERNPPDPACADKPFATSITVRRAGRATPFVIGNSDAEGAFHFALPPGSYVLTAGTSAVLPRCAAVTVVVEPSAYTTATISCDTGIR